MKTYIKKEKRKKNEKRVENMQRGAKSSINSLGGAGPLIRFAEPQKGHHPPRILEMRSACEILHGGLGWAPGERVRGERCANTIGVG